LWSTPLRTRQRIHARNITPRRDCERCG
jgi:hypothetical protein